MAETLADFVREKLNNKPFDYYEDHTGETWIGTTGKELFANGETQGCQITEIEPDKIQVNLSFRWHYVRKFYRGIGSEYEREPRDDNGIYKFEVQHRGFRGLVINETAREAFESDGRVLNIEHDSARCGFQGVIEDVIANLRN